jgi:hypothetical protein
MTLPPRLRICDNSPNEWQLSKATDTNSLCRLHVAFKITHMFDCIIKSCMPQADGLQNRGVHPASHSTSNEGFSPGVKRPGSEGDNSVWCEGEGRVKPYLPSRMPSWCAKGQFYIPHQSLL